MEVFSEAYDAILSVWVFVVMGIKGFFAMFLKDSHAAFCTALSLTSFQTFFMMRNVFGVNIFKLMIKHYGLWVYALIIAFMFLFISNDVSLNGNDRKARDASSGSLFVMVFGAFGLLSARSQINITAMGVRKAMKRDD